MTRPHIICLMATSVDGKILSHTWGNAPEVKTLAGKFEQVHEIIGIKAWVVGRTTMEKDFTEYREPTYKEGSDPIDRNDFIADSTASSFAIAVDRSGKLGWENGTMLGDHVITILSESVSDAYLRHLRSVGVSYIFAGKDTLDLKTAVEKLYTTFGIEKLMLEGGGKLNGSFLQAGLIDEAYQLLLPVIDGKANTSTFFETENEQRENTADLLKLESVERIDDDVLWLKYTLKRQ